MKTGSLRLRAALVTLAALALALGGFATVVTLRYRENLESDLYAQLNAGARAVRLAPADQIKPLIAGLALEGIEVGINYNNVQAANEVIKGGAVSPAPLKTRSVGGLAVVEEPLGHTQYPNADVRLTASQQRVTGPVRRLVVQEVVGGMVALGLGIVLTLGGLRAVFVPLTHVGDVAARIARGDRTRRLRPSRPGTQLGKMAASFDTMVDALDDAIEQAHHSESTMRRFLADASHELRTPVAALQATVETLLREQPSRPTRDALEAQVARETARLGRLIDDLLNLARLEASEPLREEVVDLQQVAQTVVSEAEAKAPNTSIELTHHGVTTVMGDADALARALRNLIENSVTATGDSGRVQIKIEGSETEIITSISDDGPGVPAEQRKRIFQGFVRLPGAKSQGVGLGLAIALRIARQHRGHISCDEVAVGARFTIRIPAACHVVAATADGRDRR